MAGPSISIINQIPATLSSNCFWDDFGRPLLSLVTIFFLSFLHFLDCTLPFSVGIRTSNETRGGAAVNEIRGQKWDQEEESLHARGVCLNYEQILCN